MHEVKVTAHALGLDVATFEIRRPANIAPAFDALKDRAEALYVVNEPLTVTNRFAINTLAHSTGRATAHDARFRSKREV